ncbi:MAG TPA: hypothetical protein VEZ90_05130, partial [Blastocatellia bacterium]|nr:hypothetical protein [Blastocatellia bacterium]
MSVLDAQQIGLRAEELAAEFLVCFQTEGNYLRDNINQLAEFAAYGDEVSVHAAGDAIFKRLVEPLADSFEPASVELYNRFFAQIVQFARGVEADLNRELSCFGLHDEEGIVRRVNSLRPAASGRGKAVDPGSHRAAGGRVRLVIVLSRVTLGADVSVTSVIIERLKSAYPVADIVLTGGRKTSELFGGDRRLRFANLEYSRGGTLLERLMSWIDLLHEIGKLTHDLHSEDVVIVDPDSRLTQLGVLPVADATGYFFFPSREYSSANNASLGQLASHWSASVFGGRGKIVPVVNPVLSDTELGQRVVGLLGRHGRRPVVTVNFGVGENPRKRVGRDFEDSVVGSLIQKGFRVVLDRGAAEEESMRIDSILARVCGESSGVRVFDIDERNLSQAEGE